MELKIAAQPPLFLPIADAKDYVWRIVIFFHFPFLVVSVELFFLFMATRASIRPRIVQAYIAHGGVRVDMDDVRHFLVSAEIEPNDVLIQRLVGRLISDKEQSLVNAAAPVTNSRRAGASPRREQQSSNPAPPQVPIDDLVEVAVACLRSSDRRQQGGDANYCLTQAWLACGGDEGFVGKIERWRLLRIAQGFGVVLDLPEEEDASFAESRMTTPSTAGTISFGDFVAVVSASKEILQLAAQHGITGGSGASKQNMREAIGNTAKHFSDDEAQNFLRNVLALAKLRRALRTCILARRRRKADAAAKVAAAAMQPARRVSIKTLGRGDSMMQRHHNRTSRKMQPKSPHRDDDSAPSPPHMSTRAAGAISVDDGTSPSTLLPYVLHATPRHQHAAAVFPSVSSTTGTSLQQGPSSATGTTSSAPFSLALTSIAQSAKQAIGPLTPITLLATGKHRSARDNATNFSSSPFYDANENADVDLDSDSAARKSFVPRKAGSVENAVAASSFTHRDIAKRLQELLSEAQAKARPALTRMTIRKQNAATQVSEEEIQREVEAAVAAEAARKRDVANGQHYRKLPKLRLLPPVNPKARSRK